MPASSQLECTLSGTLAEFTSQLDKPYSDKTEQLYLVNRFLFYRMDQASDRTFRFFLDARIKESVGQCNTYPLYDPGEAMIRNAIDSVTERFSQGDSEYKAILRLQLSVDGDQFCFEMEDNGTGIAPNIEPILYQGVMASPKRGHPQFCGGFGADLTMANDKIKKMGGKLYHQNKGQNQGAIFGYSVPINVLARGG